MADYPIPKAASAIADARGAPTREWYNFFRTLLGNQSGEAFEAQLQALAERVSELEEGEAASFIIQGGNSITVYGTPAGGVVQIGLFNDVNNPGPTYHYATDANGLKGWYPVEQALAANAGELTKTVDPDTGVTSFGLAAVPDSGVGTLRGTTRDAYGRVSGTTDATITGTSGEIDVANGDASSGPPTLSLADVTATAGGTLQKTAFDAKGRRSQEAAATTDDLPEGAVNLYFTNERAQDAVGNAVDGTGDVPLSYNDATGAISAALSAGVQASLAEADSSVQSVVAGTNVTVDNTDPRNPIISATGGGGGGVTGVTGTAPIVSSGGTTPDISITPATTSAPGSMSAADKTKLDSLPASAQPLDADLTAIAGANPTANQGIYWTGPGAVATYSLTAGGRALAGVAGTANTVPYFSAANVVTLQAVSASGRNLWNIGGTAGNLAYLSAANTWSLAPITAFGRSLIDDADAPAARATIGAEPAVAAGTTAQYWRGDKTWRDFMTDVRATVLTGLSTATNAPITATDTVLQAHGKLQAQVSANSGSIDGLEMEWVSGTSLRVTSGSAYIESLGYLIKVSSGITKAGLTLSPNTWYHVYLFYNAGAPDIEIVTTSPAAPYSGTARSKTGDASRRYVGSVKTASDGSIWRFNHNSSNNAVIYYTGISASEFNIITNGLSQYPTYQTVNCGGVVPITSKTAAVFLEYLETSVGNCYITNVEVTPAGGTIFFLRPQKQMFGVLALDSTQQFAYSVGPGAAAGLNFYVTGYFYKR